ncbi:MAG: AAA family ATPase [Thermoplasmatota archaeon]
MKGRLGRIRRTAGVFLLVALLTAVLFPIADEAEGAWDTNVFEEAVSITRYPDHENDRSPLNDEPLHIIIQSKKGQFINHADISYTWSIEGVQSSPGGFAFSRINQTTLEVEIPGYTGGTTISYNIIAYDEANHPLQSTTYSYKVVKDGSWQGDVFTDNILVEWGPMEPKNGEPILINITSIDPTVTFQRADLIYTVSIPDQDPQEGVTYFKGINSTHMNATINFYPPGSSVSFRIDAYDKYLDKITSENYFYEYEDLPEAEPIYTGYLFVILRDVSNKRPAEKAIVTFSNDTYSYTTESVNGIAFTNVSVFKGTYDITVDYNDKTYEYEVAVPTPDGRFTFNYDINQKTYEVPFENEDRPYWIDVIGVVLLIAFTIMFIILASKVKGIRESINERKKKMRRRADRSHKDKWYEKLLMDEEKKTLVIRTAAFLVLSLLGLLWAPFYPWWMIIILAVFVTAVSLRYPFISLLLMAVFVSASAAYQSREFGWIFLVFSLVTMIGGFFDWRYAYLTYLTVFAAGLGVGFAVPLAAALTMSIFMGSVVLITAGIFLLIIAPSGNFVYYSLIATSAHERSFVTFSREVDPNWSPVDFVNAIGSLSSVDTNIISTVLSETGTSLMPFVGLLGWGAAMVAIYLIFKRVEKDHSTYDPKLKGWLIRLIPGAILIVTSVVTFLWAEVDFSIWYPLALLGCIPASLLPFAVRKFGEETLPMEYGVEEIKSTDIGKKISEMVGFRRATFNDIGGLEEVKREVKNALMVPLLEPEMATRYGVKPSKGMLLFGPPGCGKTLMLRAVASDLNVDMIGIKCSDVMSKWYGESENLIASLFEEARARSPCILFLDEIDSIAKRRDFYSTDDVTPRVLSIMLSEMDGMDEAEGIIVVATTNMPDLVDPALMRPGRFDKVIYVPPPDEVSRIEILKVHIKGKFVDKDIDIEKIARETKGFSGADIANLVREASSLGLEKALETKEPQPITQEDFKRILEEIKPSITPKMIQMYDKLRQEYQRKERNGMPRAEPVKEKEKIVKPPSPEVKPPKNIPTPPPIPKKKELNIRGEISTDEVNWEG